MSRMFEGAAAFNQDLDTWNTANVTGGGMSYMFYAATSFNGKIGTWNTAKITDFQYFLRGASQFNQDVSNWNTGKVTNFTSMFYGTKFRGDVSKWNVTKATTMYQMFSQITPPVGWSGLRGTPWLNRIITAWAKQNVNTDVRLDFSDVGGGYPKYTIAKPNPNGYDYSNGTEAAFTKLTRSKWELTNPGKSWYITTGGTTYVNSPGVARDFTMTRTGDTNAGPEYGNGSSATFNWLKPDTGDTGAPITYTVQSTTDAGVLCTVTEAYTCTIDDLVGDTFHQFTVTAGNAVGDSDPTDAIPPKRLLEVGATPVLATPTPTADGFTVVIENYDNQYKWSGTATQGGVVAIDQESGIATVTGVPVNTTAQATITATKFGYTERSATTSAKSLQAKLDPVLELIDRTATGFRVRITNYDDPDRLHAAAQRNAGFREPHRRRRHRDGLEPGHSGLAVGAHSHLGPCRPRSGIQHPDLQRPGRPR